MFLLLPWRVDVPEDRLPIGNWLILIGIFAAFSWQVYLAANDMNWFEQLDAYVLDGWALSGVMGHMWLHGGLLHLIGNMIFLWIFGNAICAKVGTPVYLGLYLMLGICAAAAHVLFTGGPAIGASGAINGVVGMFLVLYPQNDITCWYFYWVIFLRAGAFTVSSIWMILYWLGWDIFGVVAGFGGVAYWAHLGGFFSGAAIAVLLLKMKLVKTERYERSLLEWLAGEKDPGSADVSQYGDHLHRELQRVKAQEPAGQYQTEPVAAATASAGGDSDEDILASIAQARMIRFSCACGKQIKVKSKYAGRSGRCPACKNKIRVPV